VCIVRGYVDSTHPRANPDTGPSSPRNCWRFIVWALGLKSSAYPETGKIPRAQSVSVQAAIHTPHTSNQHHEAVLPEIFSDGKRTPAYHGTQRLKTS